MPELDFICHIDAAAPKMSDLKAVSGVAYSGGAIRQPWSPLPIVVDLAGLQLAAQVPLLFNHANDPDYRLGAVEMENDGESLRFKGGLDLSAPRAKAIAEQGSKFHWQVSIGATPLKAEKVKEGEVRAVNGREFSGPFLHVLSAKLTEISVVAVGADTDTQMKIAAAMRLNHKENEMPNELKKALDPAAKQTVEAAEPAPQKVEAAAPVVDAAKVEEEIRAAALARVEKLQEVTKDYPAIQARALKEGWDLAKAEAYVEGMKAAMAALPPAAPNVLAAKPGATPELRAQAIEAALAGAMMLDVEKDYSEEALKLARTDYRGLTLQGAFKACARAEGKQVSDYGMGEDDIRAALSTLSLPNVLSNVQQKMVWKGYASVPMISKQLCTTGTVADFKETRRVRITDIDDPEQLAPGGELKHTTFSDEEVTNRLFSYGLMMEIDRTMIINDDMGMLNQIPTMLGQKMATYEEKFFWKYLLSNPGNMFSAAHGNYATGASSALGIDSLTNLRGTFQKQTNSKGDPIAVAPSYLIVPVELEIEARKLLSCDTLIAVGMDNGKKVIPNQNVCTQFGLTLLTSHYLSNAGIPGNSATGWYLAAAPSDVLSFEMLFLNGKANPTVERSDVDFNRLGIAYRVYHDFGLKCIDYRGWAFATGV